jgi:hypothetical protein
MRIDSPQSVGIISGFGIPTGGTINQVLSKVDSDNYDTQWTTVSGSSGSTLSFTAKSNITEGYAVRLDTDGKIISTDYTTFGRLESGTFGSSNSGSIQDITYVNSTNQVLALGFTNNLPILYVGTVNTTTKEISYGSGTQLSTNQLLSGTQGIIHYDAGIDRALVAYPMSGNQINVIGINRSGSSYSVGVVSQLTFDAVVPTEVRISSNNSNRFYLSCRNNNANLKIKSLDVGSSFITTLSTSSNIPGLPTTHGLVWYKTDRVAAICFASGSVFMNVWNVSTNAWIGANIAVITVPFSSNQIKFDAFNGVNPQNFVAGFVGTQNSYAITWTLTDDITVTGRNTIFLDVSGTNPQGVWLPNPYNLFYSVLDGINSTVRSTNLALAPIIGLNAATTTYPTFATNGFFQDTVGTYYGVGINPNDASNKLFWNSFGDTTYTNLPIVGIAQKTGVPDDIIDVAVENTVSKVQTGLVPGSNYYADSNGSLILNGYDYMGFALSPTELNVMFNNPPGSLTTSNWSLSSGYSQNDLVINQRSLYQANNTIPPNTSFTVGTTGTTWSQIGAPIPSGGTTGQILRKVNNTDYNTEWYGLSYASILFNSLNTNANQDQTPVLGPTNGITVVGNTMVISRPGIYSLNANLAFRAGFVEYRWVDSSNTQLVGTNVGVTGSLTSTEAVSPSPAAGIVNITSPNTVIKLRNGNVSTIGTQVPGYAIATITQIA